MSKDDMMIGKVGGGVSNGPKKDYVINAQSLTVFVNIIIPNFFHFCQSWA